MQADRLSKKHSKAVKKALSKKAAKKKAPKKKKAAKKTQPKKNTVSKKLVKKVRKVCKPSEKTQTVEVHLESPASDSFRCQMAANSLDIDVKKKLSHHLKIENVDLEGEFNIGLVIGASGSGKTTLATKLFGTDVFTSKVDPTTPIIDQFPEGMEYDDCANILSGIGLSSVPCWIRPVSTLSNGQKSRAEAALVLLPI